ncbi:MAG: glycosyltransferase family 4 protein [Alphaproteobacteria bacterium]
MKILFAIKALDDAQGGAERVLANITSGLAGRGNDVCVLSFDPPGGESFYPLHEKVERIALGIGDVKGRASAGEVVSRMVAVRKAARRVQPDVVIAFMHSSFIPVSFAMAGTGIPVIGSEHIVPDHYKNRKTEYLLLLLSGFFLKKITVLSSSIIEGYSPVLRPKMRAIANPVFPAKEYAEPQGTGAARKIILNVGRLCLQKDQDTLIRAFAMLADKYPDWDLRIIGEGTLRCSLQDTVSELGLGARIFLPGTTAEIDKEYQGAHIFALSSKYESFGLATAEAMAHGLPAIGFGSCPGTNELIVHNQNGLLVEEGDRVAAFAQGLERLMRDDQLRVDLGKRGLETVKKFHLDEIVGQWEALVKRVVEEAI